MPPGMTFGFLFKLMTYCADLAFLIDLKSLAISASIEVQNTAHS